MAFPLERVYRRYIQPASGITADPKTIVDKVEEAETVIGVEYVPSAALSGADTNSRTLNLYNRQTGAGTVLVATLALTNGINLVDNVPKALTLQAAANLALAAGDVLEFESLHVGTGITDPGGLLRVRTRRT